MKNFLFAIIFLGLTMYLSYELYQRSQKEDADDMQQVERVNEAAALTYPSQIQIARADGSSLDISLTARNSVYFQFERLSDGQAFTFAIDQLDQASQERVLQYPDTGLLITNELIQSKQLTTEDLYVEQLRAAISKINMGIQGIELKFNNSQSKTERRTLKNQVEELLKERGELETKIAERK
ncbi:hypothetical protein ACWPKS_02210 [Coraliomargarita sp. W4R72]